MFRRRPRTSRTLIGILVVVIVLGLVSYWHNTSKSTAEPVASSDSMTTKAPPPADSVVPTRTETPAASRAKTPEAPMTTVTPSAPAAGRSASSAKPPTPAARPLTPAAKPLQSPTTQPKTTAAPSGPPLVQAKALYQSGELLAARDIANNALIAGDLSPADATAAKDLIREINQSVVFGPKRYPNDPYGGTYSVQSGDILSKIARNHDVTAELLCRLNGISDPRKLRAGATIKVVPGPFHAVVDKSDYTMDLYLGEPAKSGSMYITTYRVGLGAEDSTPTGIWMVETDTKLKNPQYHSPRGEGIIAADDPKNPLGEFWIGLTGIEGDAVGKPSYGIHGTIEPDSIGKQASLGCIRLLNEDVAVVYEMLVEGKSTVIVKE